MKQTPALPLLSLRTKLVLSYLAVALGAVVVLAVAVVLAINNYFLTVQIEQLRRVAATQAQAITNIYIVEQSNWHNIPWRNAPSPYLFVVVDATNNQVFCDPPPNTDRSACTDPALSQALGQALQGQETYGRLPAAANIAGIYDCSPLYNNGRLIGALFVAAPEQTPSDAFLGNVNQAILITGMMLTVVVIAFSLLLARRLTRPLESLTVAADKLKGGDYSQRVIPPRAQDELGRLAQTFNAMADTIEADVNELRHQEQMRRDLIANIAHDLATPLTAIQGFSEALADNVIQAPGERLETAQLIAREVQRLRRLVADMQQMSSIESGRAHLDLAPLDLSALVDETLAVMEPECTQAGITLRAEFAVNTPLVLADSDRVTQVLLNLVDNARRHTPSGGTITIGARQEGKILTVWIRDTGQGIDPIDLPHIFERFYRADRARTGSTGGSGLGLSIVKAIITAHGGTIGATSTPGQRTCIKFTLPLAPAVA
ncbi:MAG: HAMP domain-containing sensor histidine kinase [Ktedonobacteraceae bacterium]